MSETAAVASSVIQKACQTPTAPKMRLSTKATGSPIIQDGMLVGAVTHV